MIANEFEYRWRIESMGANHDRRKIIQELRLVANRTNAYFDVRLAFSRLLAFGTQEWAMLLFLVSSCHPTPIGVSMPKVFNRMSSEFRFCHILSCILYSVH